MAPIIRRFSPDDASSCYDAFYDAVRNGTAPHYSAEQAAAWARYASPDATWAPRLEGANTWLAEVDGTVLGFIALYPYGYLDLFFVRSDARKMGIAGLIYDALLADIRDLDVLTTDASILARRFFEKRGWEVIGTETANRNGMTLTQYPMRLNLLRSG
ncbi:MAG: GNAT family N-acetyltransferase [Pseudomonadota bacterium]